MIPIAPGFFRPQGQGDGWQYYGAVLSLMVWQKGGSETASGFYDDGSDPYYASNDPDNFVYDISTANPVDLDYTDPSNDVIIPFTFNANTRMRSEAYENDVLADVASHVWQLLDADDNNIYKFECVGRAANYGVDCWHTIGNGTRTQIAATGSYPALKHLFSFSGTTITATDEYGGSNHINSYTATSVDLASATQLKVSGGRAYMSHGGTNLFSVYSRVAYWPDGIPT